MPKQQTDLFVRTAATSHNILCLSGATIKYGFRVVAGYGTPSRRRCRFLFGTCRLLLYPHRLFATAKKIILRMYLGMLRLI